MTTITITAEQAAHAREHGVLVVEGEPDSWCLAAWPDCTSGGYDPSCCRFPKSCSVDQVPPAALTALVGDCETCDDSGLIAGWMYGEVAPGVTSHIPCPDCDGLGYRPLTVHAECPICHTKSEWCGYDEPGNLLCSAGKVRFTCRVIEVLPIHGRCPRFEPADHICRWSASWLWHRSRSPIEANAYNTEQTIALPPDAEVGMYAVLVDNLKETP